MNILLNGPARLTEQDKSEIFQNIQDIIDRNNELTLFLKSSFEVEVLRFLLTHMKDYDKDIFSRVTLYTLYDQELLSHKYQTLVSFAVEHGATWFSLQYKREDSKPNAIDRRTLTSFWNQIIPNTQLVIVFMDDQEFHQLIPLDEARRAGMEAVKCYLYRAGKSQHEGSVRARTVVFRAIS